jgi:hypothetical protein
LNPISNEATGTGYVDRKNRGQGARAFSHSSARIQLGLAHESAFVVFNASQTFSGSGALPTYPMFCSSGSCQHTGTPASTNLAGTPLFDASGKETFQHYDAPFSS